MNDIKKSFNDLKPLKDLKTITEVYYLIFDAAIETMHSLML